MKYLFNGISLKNKRRTNMDSLLLKNGSVGGKNALLAVVCDGVGSMSDGAFASGAAVRMLSEWFDNIMDTSRIGLKLRDAISEINIRIISDAKGKNKNTASTLSALLLMEDTYYIVHIGDSRIYSFQDKELLILTKDDISESGKLTACIGKKEQVVLQYSEGKTAGKTFLLCSDGLYKKMDNAFMISKMRVSNKRGLKESMESLTKYVMDYGEQDNISLAIIKIEG